MRYLDETAYELNHIHNPMPKGVEEFKEEKMKTIIKKKNGLAWFILFLAWLIPVLFCWKFGESLLDSDMAAEMVLAKQLNDEGSLLSTNWLYGSEIRIFAQQFFFKIGLFFFPNRWDLVRLLTQAFLLLATAFSYLYMTGILPNKQKNVYFAAMLLCPFGFWHLWHDIYDGIYLLHLIAYMLSAGLIFRVCLYKKRKGLRLLLLFLLSFERGLEGVRLLMNLYVPMVLASILVLYLSMRDLEGSFNHVSLNRELKLIGAAVCGLIGSSAGYLINIRFLSTHYHFLSQSKILWTKFSFNRILEVISSFLRIFGYPVEDYISFESEYLLSIPGLLSCFSLILMGMVCFSLFRTAKKISSFKLEERLMILTCLSSLLVTVVIFSITDYQYTGRYYLPFLPAVIALLSIEWETENFQLKFGRSLYALILALSVLCCSLSTMRHFKNYAPRACKDIQNITASILGHGYTQGIATFWYGDVITELSNGQAEMWLVGDLKSFHRKEYLQSAAHLQELPQGKGVFVVDSASLYFDYYANIPDSELIYDRYGIKIVGVEDMQAVYDALEQATGSEIS